MMMKSVFVLSQSRNTLTVSSSPSLLTISSFSCRDRSFLHDLVLNTLSSESDTLSGKGEEQH